MTDNTECERSDYCDETIQKYNEFLVLSYAVLDLSKPIPSEVEGGILLPSHAERVDCDCVHCERMRASDKAWSAFVDFLEHGRD